MATLAVYEGFDVLQQAGNWVADTVKFYAASNAYTPDEDHTFASFTGSGAQIGDPVVGTGKSVNDGELRAGDPVFVGIADLADNIDQVAVTLTTGGTERLLFVITTPTLDPSGADIAGRIAGSVVGSMKNPTP